MSSETESDLPILPYPTHKLTEEEIADPLLVLQDFFSFGHLPDVRQMLWDWLRATVTGTFPKELDRRERNEILYLYEYLERLIEAAHLINEQRKKSQL